jgi:hypothetical protein
MRSVKAFLSTGFFLLGITSWGQITLLGFDQEQCGILTNDPYTYKNVDGKCGSHRPGYEIYFHDSLVYDHCCTWKNNSLINWRS